MEFGKWTKISEQLPLCPKQYEVGHYLITTDNNQVVSAEYVIARKRGEEIVRWEWRGRICPWEVIAWMPFPQPYKE